MSLTAAFNRAQKQALKLTAGKPGAVSEGPVEPIAADEFSQLKKRYWGPTPVGCGYFWASVGAVDEETIRRNIENSSRTIL